VGLSTEPADALMFENAKTVRPLNLAAMRAEEPSLPGGMLALLTRVTAVWPEGGKARLGSGVAEHDVDPSAWFFKAHFFQDPVCPGSLGLESFQQLLKAVARERWIAGAAEDARFTPVTLGQRHEWVYRGQVIPRKKVVTVEAVITAADDRQRRLTADGMLSVDGLLIYQMKDFSLSVA
jgi:3-hydroxymyristoyl/3-hydroxydecanoyl-(acyl carrier protein) dehydratase